MRGQHDVKTPTQYLAKLAPERKKEVTALHKMIRKAAPSLKPVIHLGMLGYGPFQYRYASGREGDACTLAIASNASAISFYVLAADESGWVAERYKKALPKASIGKSCIRFKKTSDLDPVVIGKLIREAQKVGFDPASQG